MDIDLHRCILPRAPKIGIFSVYSQGEVGEIVTGECPILSYIISFLGSDKQTNFSLPQK